MESPTSERSNFTRRDVYLLLMDQKGIDVHGGKKADWHWQEISRLVG